MPDLDAIMRFWADLLGLNRDGWRIQWRWENSIPHPGGREAVGLNTVDGHAREATIQIRRPRSAAELAGIEDTCAHELVHCIGARMEALMEAGETTAAHEYLAETLAPAMVRGRGTSRAKVLAKAANGLHARPRVGGEWKLDNKSLLAILAVIMAASSPEEKDKLLSELKAQVEGMADGSAAPVAEPPMAQEAPSPPPPRDEGAPELGMSEEERLAKDPAYKALAKAFVEGLCDARADLTAEQREFAIGLGTPAKAKAFFRAIPKPVSPTPAPVAAPAPEARMGLEAAPRGGAGDRGTRPSGDKRLNELFRLADEGDGDGVEHPDPRSTGVLLRHSVVGAHKLIKKNTAALIQRAKGGAQ